MTRILTAAVTAAALALGLAGAAIPAAAAATATVTHQAVKAPTTDCPATISVPNVRVHNSSPEVWGYVKSICNEDPSDAPCWSVRTNQHDNWSDYVDALCFDYSAPPSDWPGPYKAVFNFDPWTFPLGVTYRAGWFDGTTASGDPVQFATTDFTVKLSTRDVTSGYRSGNYVYIRSHATRYNYKTDTWVASADRSVTFFRYHNSVWQAKGTATTSAKGYTPYVKIWAPTKTTFRSQVSQTPKMWNATSKPITH